MSPTVRLAREGDLERLREIERLAGRLFAEIGMTLVAEDEPASVEELRAFVAEGRSFVAEAPDLPGVPAGYLLVAEVDGRRTSGAGVRRPGLHRSAVGQVVGRAGCRLGPRPRLPRDHTDHVHRRCMERAVVYTTRLQCRRTADPGPLTATGSGNGTMEVGVNSTGPCSADRSHIGLPIDLQHTGAE